MNNKRFLVFCYDEYYPTDGMSDLAGSFDTLEEAIAFCEKQKSYNYVEIYDRVNGVEVNFEREQ